VVQSCRSGAVVVVEVIGGGGFWILGSLVEEK
jgi:hypothetical protein